MNTPQMSHKIDPWDPHIQTIVQSIRETPLDNLRAAVSEWIPFELRPAVDFVNSLSADQQADVFKACLIVFLLSNSHMVPRKIQLQAALASLAGRDSKLISGTGSGKTLTIALPHLLQPDRVSLVISPLKRLQVTQVRGSTRLLVLVIEISGRSQHSKDGGQRLSRSTRIAQMILNGLRCVCYIFPIAFLSYSTLDNSKSIQDLPDST